MAGGLLNVATCALRSCCGIRDTRDAKKDKWSRDARRQPATSADKSSRGINVAHIVWRFSKKTSELQESRVTKAAAHLDTVHVSQPDDVTQDEINGIEQHKVWPVEVRPHTSGCEFPSPGAGDRNYADCKNQHRAAGSTGSKEPDWPV